VLTKTEFPSGKMYHHQKDYMKTVRRRPDDDAVTRSRGRASAG
jgi:hypothetical protein